MEVQRGYTTTQAFDPRMKSEPRLASYYAACSSAFAGKNRFLPTNDTQKEMLTSRPTVPRQPTACQDQLPNLQMCLQFYGLLSWRQAGLQVLQQHKDATAAPHSTTNSDNSSETHHLWTFPR